MTVAIFSGGCILSLGNFPFLQNAQIFPSLFVAPFAILQRSCGEQLPHPKVCIKIAELEISVQLHLRFTNIYGKSI